MKWVKDQEVADDKSLETVYQSYLQAMLIGYQDNFEQLGKTITIGLEDFANYVSDETQACFIDSVELYYDCSLTRMGITLVDRSEEHTSELQSRGHLVCRLLLEKKNKY